MMNELLTQAEILALSEADRQDWRDKILEQLRWLNVYPKSDWHRGFEAFLKADAYEAIGGQAEVIVEHPLGEAPPRIDFIVWLHDDETKLQKSIYRIFRRFNVIEYKNPHDNLNWRVIYKAIGYASLYLGLAKSEEERPKDQITISIFRAVKNPDLFKELEEAGHLEADEIKGIYHVHGLTEFPFQIVIMTELEGKEYAAARAMVDQDRAKPEDILQLLDCIQEEKDEIVRDHMREVLDLISKKNPTTIKTLGRRNTEMSDVLLEILEPKLAERDAKRDETRDAKRDAERDAIHDAELKNNILFSIVQEGKMSLESAAAWLHLSIQEFSSQMKQNGFTIPSHATVQQQA